MNLDFLIDWKVCRLDIGLTLTDIIEIGQWCDCKFGKEADIANGWWLGPGLEIHFRDEEMLTEFILTWL